MMNNQVDFLYNFTKEEIICWMRQNYWLNRLRKSEMLFIRWQIESEKLAVKEKKNLADMKSIDWAQRDEYARQYNAEGSIHKKLELLGKIRSYDDLFADQIAESTKLRKQGEKLEKLYKSIDKAREEESGA